MPKTKKHHTFSWSSGGQFVKSKSSYKDIQENVEFIECECESGEIGSSSEQDVEEEAIGETIQIRRVIGQLILKMGRV